MTCPTNKLYSANKENQETHLLMAREGRKLICKWASIKGWSSQDKKREYKKKKKKWGDRESRQEP